MNRSLFCCFVPSILCVMTLTVSAASAHEKGLNSGSWTKGATLKVFADALPADPPAGITQDTLNMALEDAVKAWNDAQAEFGGLMLMTAGATKENADIHVSWGKALASWGETNKKDSVDKNNNGFGKDTVRMKVDINDGLNQRGITRVLIHEMGHAEGLGHSAASDVMKADAFTSTPGSAPTAADLNSAAALPTPTADDKAGKKELWGTKEKLNKTEATGSANFNPSSNLWIYNFSLFPQDLPLIPVETPITSWHLEVGPLINAPDVTLLNCPPGWNMSFFDGDVGLGPGSKFLNILEAPAPSLVGFLTNDPLQGLLPGGSYLFQFASRFGPGQSMAHTNSPSFDSDDFLLPAPMVPEPATIVLALLVGLTVWLARGRRV